MSERQFLDKAQAIAMLPDGDEIHTFLNPGGILIGADWSRADVLNAIDLAGEREIEVGGEQCRRMGHGLVIWQDGRPMFVETKKESA